MYAELGSMVFQRQAQIYCNILKEGGNICGQF